MFNASTSKHLPSKVVAFSSLGRGGGCFVLFWSFSGAEEGGSVSLLVLEDMCSNRPALLLLRGQSLGDFKRWGRMHMGLPSAMMLS